MMTKFDLLRNLLLTEVMHTTETSNGETSRCHWSNGVNAKAWSHEATFLAKELLANRKHGTQ